MYYRESEKNNLVCCLIEKWYSKDEAHYYYEALKRFPHHDYSDQTCRWPKWTTMHYKGFCTKRKNTEAWKNLIKALEKEKLIAIDRAKNVKPLYK